MSGFGRPVVVNRRDFLKTMLAAAAAPAYVRYGSLMVPTPITQQILTPYATDIIIDQSMMMRGSLTGAQITARQIAWSEAVKAGLDPLMDRWRLLLLQAMKDYPGATHA